MSKSGAGSGVHRLTYSLPPIPSVPEEVKKLFKMDNSFRLELNNYIRAERNRRYQRHPFDNESLEVRIANYTSQIRQLKQVIYDLPNNVMCKIYVSLYKDKRTKCLNELYRMDAARYHAIVKDLNIDHVLGMPGVDTYMKDQRKRSLRRLTDAYCHNMKKGKLEAYHEKLKAQQEPFLKEAEEANKWIEQEMAKYHISEEDLETGFKPRKRYRDPHPVRPLVQELSQ